jgi:hypothetical protein
MIRLKPYDCVDDSKHSVRVMRVGADDVDLYKRFSEFHALRERCDERTRVINIGALRMLVVVSAF